MSDDQVAVLVAARALFRRQGVAATSMREIARASGVPAGSLTHHFPGGKPQLVARVVSYSADEMAAALEAGLSAAPPAEAFGAITDMIGAVLEGSGWWEGSPLAIIALEVGAHDEPVRLALLRGFRAMEGIIAAALTRDGVEHERAAELSVTVIAAIEGAVMRARVERSLEPLGRVQRQIALLLASACPGG